MNRINKSIVNKPVKGFTLIELLTVIAIIAVLAGILLPVLGRIRATADNTKCVSNLKNLHSGFMLYVQDNNGELPPTYDPAAGVTWASALLDGEYLPRVRVAEYDSRNEIFGCPTQKDWVDDPLARTYGVNQSVASNSTRRRYNSLVSPAQTLLMADGHYTEGASVPFNIGLSTSIIPTPTHLQSEQHVNCLYADGHVGSRSTDSTDAGFPRGVGAPGSKRYLFWTGR